MGEAKKSHRLVFYGVEIDSIRMQLLPYQNYCQDILEARLRAVLYEQLNISRDILFDWVVRLEGEGWANNRKPILASLTNQADKWEILCLARHVVSYFNGNELRHRKTHCCPVSYIVRCLSLPVWHRRNTRCYF